MSGLQRIVSPRVVAGQVSLSTNLSKSSKVFQEILGPRGSVPGRSGGPRPPEWL
jgi:hypothetical protein